MVRKKIRAFTMAEIMIVLAVIAVITIATVGIQKSRKDYVNKFMYYSAFTALQKASSEMFAEGSSITTDTTTTVPADDDDVVGACPTGQTYVANAAETAFYNWKSKWDYMEANFAFNCDAAAADCVAAHNAVNAAAGSYYSYCTDNQWKNAACKAMTYTGSSGSCQANQLKGYYTDAAIEAVWDAFVGLSDTCGWDGNKNACLNSPFVAQYNTAIANSKIGSPCQSNMSKSSYYPYPSDNPYSDKSKQGIGWCYYPNPAITDNTGDAGSGGSTTTTTSTTSLLKILPETAAKFCSRFTDMMNGVGSTVCTNAAQTEPFTSANANLTLANGIRFYNFGSEATVDSTDPTHMKDYYTIYADIDGSARSGKLNDDVMGFKIYRSGLVIPLSTTAPSIKYLSASVKYKDASNKIQILENNVPYLYAACHAGITTGSDCPAGQTIDPKCNKAAGGFSCSPVMNKPGF